MGVAFSEEVQTQTQAPQISKMSGVCVVMMHHKDPGVMEAIIRDELKDRVCEIVRFVRTVPSTDKDKVVSWYKDTRKLRSLCRPQRDLVVTFEGIAWDREFMLSDLFMWLLRMAKIWNILVIVEINDSLQMAPESRDHVNMRYKYDDTINEWTFQSAPSALRRRPQISTFR